MVFDIGNLLNSLTENFDPPRKLLKLIQIINLYIYIIECVEKDEGLKAMQIKQFRRLRDDIQQYRQRITKKDFVGSTLKAAGFDELASQSLKEYKTASSQRKEFAQMLTDLWNNGNPIVPGTRLDEDGTPAATEGSASKSPQSATEASSSLSVIEENDDSDAEYHVHPDGLSDISSAQGEPVDMTARYWAEQILEEAFNLNRGLLERPSQRTVDEIFSKYMYGSGKFKGKRRIVKDPFEVALMGSSRPTRSMEAERENLTEESAEASTKFQHDRFSFEQ